MALVADVLGWSGACVALAAYVFLSLGKLTNGWLFQPAQLSPCITALGPALPSMPRGR